MDTWIEVQDWIDHILPELNLDSKKFEYWTVSLVFDGMMDTHSEFYPESVMEKGHLVHNLMRVLPEDMDPDDVVATLMTMASQFWSPQDMEFGFKMLSQISSKSAEDRLNNVPKERMH
jgi:hypothetical protein